MIRIADQVKHILIDGREPALDVADTYLHMPSVDADQIRRIGARCCEGGMSSCRGKVAVGTQQTKAITSADCDVLNATLRTNLPVVRTLCTFDDVNHTLRDALNCR